MEKSQTRCKHCKAVILRKTAERTNGYCMPHAEPGLPLKQQIGGVLESVEEVIPADVKFPGVSQEFRLGIGVEWDELLKKMKPGDRMIRFHTLPSSPDQSWYAETGYAIVRDDGEWGDGIVIHWRANPAYREHVEEVLDIDEFIREHSEDWKDLKPTMQKGDELVHFKSSPMSWASLYGREWFGVRRNGVYVASIFVGMS